MLLLEERERRRTEILAAVDTAEAALSRGERRAVTQQSMRELANEVKQRGRLRLDSEHSETSGEKMHTSRMAFLKKQREAL